MPPKKGKAKGSKASSKTEDKRREKVIEDKTFGLKNKKKSKAVQKYIAQVKKTVATGGKKEETKKAAAAAAAAKRELAQLLKSSVVKQAPLAPGVDPKSVVCEYFKQGLCSKGKRCKYSHDLTVGRKSAKIDLHADRREGEKEADSMDSWDQEKLQEVVKTKHGGSKVATTDIVCKHFLDAIEKGLYGWFWVCPSGGAKCKYRHALPPGYVFKTKAQRDAEAAAAASTEKPTVEEEIELLRAALPREGLTPVTAETFKKWKEDREVKRQQAVQAQVEAEQKKSGGKGLQGLSGRALFTFDPTLFQDDDAAGDSGDYIVHYDEDGPADAGTDHSAGAGGATGVAAPVAAAPPEPPAAGVAAPPAPASSGEGVAAPPPVPAAAPAPAAAATATEEEPAAAAVAGAAPVNEDLFLAGGDDLDDLPSDDDDDDDD